MAIEPPYSVSPAPPAPQRTQPPAVFAERADPFVTYIAGMSTQLNALAANVNNNANEAFQYSVLAASIRDATQTIANQAIAQMQQIAAQASTDTQAIADEALRASRRETQRATWAADDAEDYAAGSLQQAQVAAGHASSAQASAAAAQSAAGLPAIANKALQVLRVNAAGTGVEFGVGMARGYAEFTASTSWPRPPEASWFFVEGIGGGAAGGTGANGVGGAGGMYDSRLIRGEDLPTTVSIVVGAGGATNGDAGGASSFDTFTAPGGGTGGVALAGILSPGVRSDSQSIRSSYHAGAGGLTGSSTANDGTAGGRSYAGGGGGGGGAGGSGVQSGFAGGASVRGGAGGAGGPRTSAGAQPGSPGTAPGGGGGATSSSSGGGAGARGVIRVWWW